MIEYKLVPWDIYMEENLQTVLNQESALGWVLVTTISRTPDFVTLVFSRPS